MDNYSGLPHAEQYALLDAQSTSGQTVRAFCADRGIKETRFYTWRTRRRKRLKKEETASGFVPIQPVDKKWLSLHLTGGLELRISPEQFDMAADLLLQMDRRHIDRRHAVL